MYKPLDSIWKFLRGEFLKALIARKKKNVYKYVRGCMLTGFVVVIILQHIIYQIIMVYT